MKREAGSVRALATVVSALLLGGCLDAGEDVGPPFFLAELTAAGVAERCTADDLAMAGGIAPVVDAPASVVVLFAGEPLCLLHAGGPVTDPAALDRPPPWTSSDPGTAGEKEAKNPPPLQAGNSTGDVVQDPTPQPARPVVDKRAFAVPPPAPPPPSPNDNN